MRKFFNWQGLFYHLPPVAICTLIFWGSSLPGNDIPDLFSFQDKVFRFVVFSLLAFLTARAVWFERPLWRPTHFGLAATLFAAVYGLSDECHQLFVPFRHATALDWLTDALGGLFGSFLWTHIHTHVRVKR